MMWRATILGLAVASRPSAQTTPMSAMRRATILALALGLAACADTAPRPAPERLQVADVMGSASAAGFARAIEPRVFEFPADHGPHPAFAVEWWYFTGNLSSDDGRRFGYQLTFFRSSLLPVAERRQRPSSWYADDVWMAHFAVTDVDAGAFYAFDRFQRGALDLAGARSAPWGVWLDDWSLRQIGATPFPLRLRATHGASAAGDGGERVSLDLVLDPAKPMVLQGEDGLSRKGETPGNASYYYSYTRLATRGELGIGGAQHAVSGTSWLDREWSTSALEEGQVGWDWFALQLDDGTDLMYYQLRNADGTAATSSAGKLIADNGDSENLTLGEVDLRVTQEWRSAIDASVYPSGWILSVPERGIELIIEPLLADQELDVAFRYWEGAVSVRGTAASGAAVTGRGYVELTGYAGGGPHP